MTEKVHWTKLLYEIRWWLISLGAILVIFVLLPLGLYYFGLICLNGEINWLKQHHRPTSWAEFYCQYPTSPENSVQYIALQELIKICPDPIPGEWFRFDEDFEYNAEKYDRYKKIINESKIFYCKSVNVFNMPSLTWKIKRNEPDEDLLFRLCDSLAYMRMYVAIADKNYPAAISVWNNISRCQQIKMRNLMEESMYDYQKNFNCIEFLLSKGVVSPETLSRWKEQLCRNAIDLPANVLRWFDWENVETIVEPLEITVENLEKGCHLMTPLPSFWAFMEPLCRARKLQMSRRDYTEYYCKSLCFKHKEHSSIWRACDAVCLLINKAMTGDVRCSHLFRFFFGDDYHQLVDFAYGLRLQLQLTYTGIAAEQFRQKYGTFPKTYSDMATEFLPPADICVFNYAPLQYQYLSPRECVISISPVPQSMQCQFTVLRLCDSSPPDFPHFRLAKFPSATTLP